MPRAVSMLLRFSKLPSRAVQTVLETLDGNDDFRHMVAEGLDRDQPDRAAWLFLVRPDGWREKLLILGEAEREEREATDSNTRLRSTERHLAATREALNEARAELSAARTAMAAMEDELTGLRSDSARLRSDLGRAEAAVRSLGAERDRSQLEASDAMALAERRLGEITELSATITQLQDDLRQEDDLRQGMAATPIGPEARVGAVEGSGAVAGFESGGEPGAATIDTASMAAAFGEASVALAALMRAFERARGAVTGASTEGSLEYVLGDDAPVAADRGAGSDSSAGAVAGPSEGRIIKPGTRGVGTRGVGNSDAPNSGVGNSDAGNSDSGNWGYGRRTPIRLQRGAVEGSAEGIDQILRTPDVLVLVDGYNVAMLAWPGLGKGEQRQTLVRLLGGVAARTGADIHLVFDGVGDGSRPSVATALPVRVHFSDDETEADDVILDLVAATARPVLVVSSDKRVITGARSLGANVSTSAALLDYTRVPVQPDPTGAAGTSR